MNLGLCSTCRSIPSEFFAEEYDGDTIDHELKLCDEILQSSKRCRLCDLISGQVKTHHITSKKSDNSIIWLQRRKVGPLREVRIYHGDEILDSASWVPIPEPWSNFPPAVVDPTVQDAVELMKAWLNICRTSHPKCADAQRAYTPKRLLDLNAFGGVDDIRLVMPEIQIATEYVALSHCWGPPDKWSLQTTKETLHTRLEKNTFTSLSQTFQDAIQLTRSIGVRYLWIDSLCILQDDHDDFVREAKAMADVYTNAVCTLAALCAADGTEGCSMKWTIGPLHESEDEDLYSCHTADLPVGDIKVRVSREAFCNWEDVYGHKKEVRRLVNPREHPLRNRAWTLQERILSVRNISFGASFVFWECRTVKATLDHPWPHPEKSPDSEEAKSWPTPLTESERVLDAQSSKRDAWYQVIEEYSRRILTNQSDKLPALAGIAAVYQSESDTGIYLNGIFSRHLPSALLWRVTRHPVYEPPHTRQQAYRAPSWSWASVNGTVSYESQRMFSTDQGASTPFSNFEFQISNLTLEQTPEAFDAFGLVESAATLTLQGRLVQLGVVKTDWSFTWERLLLKKPVKRSSQHEHIDLSRALSLKFASSAPDQPDECRPRISDSGSLDDLNSDSDSDQYAEHGYDQNDVVGMCYFDVESEMREVLDVWCLSVRKEHWLSDETIYHALPYAIEGNASYEERQNMEPTVMGLALLHRPPSDTFVRVGMIRWVKESVFNDIEPRLVCID